MAMALPSTAGEPTGLLTAREIAAFKRDGYFIRRGILSAELCAAARDRLWALNETQQLDRADPRTWVGPLKGDDLSAESKNARTAYRWNCRVPGGEAVLKDLLPRNPTVLALWSSCWARAGSPTRSLSGAERVGCTARCLWETGRRRGTAAISMTT